MATQREALAQLRVAMSDARTELRDGQWEAIHHIVNRRGKVLCIQRTCWGKSMVYFGSVKPMRLRPGRDADISPLLALMRDQIEAADSTR